MKQLTNTFEFKASMIAFLMALLPFFQFLFVRVVTTSAFVTVSAPLAIVVSILYGRKIYPYLFIGSWVGWFLRGELQLDLPLGVALHLGLFYSLVLIFITEIGRRLVVASGLLSASHGRIFVLGLAIALIMGLFAGLLVQLHAFLVLGDTAEWTHLFIGISGFTLSILLFGPFLYLSFNETLRIPRDRRLKWMVTRTVYLMLYLLTTGLLIAGIGQFEYTRHLYILSGFFIIGALFMSYRMLLALQMIFLLTYGVFRFDPTWSDEAFYFDTLILYSFMFVTVLLALVIKDYVFRQRSQNEKLYRTNVEFDRTLDYVHRFLNLSKHILTDTTSKEVYAKETFEISNFIFAKADASFAYFEEEGAIDMALSKGYPIKDIPFLYELHDTTLVRNRDTIYHRDIKRQLKNLYKGFVMPSEYSYLDNAKRVYLVFRFNTERIFVVGFDYYTEPDAITKEALRRSKEFTTLFNKLFMKQHLDMQNRAIKEDIIRSFVRTLDLYDRYTKGHSDDVANLSLAIAKKLDKEQSFLDNIYWAGMLHDIGKLGVKYDILNKEDRLSEDEYDHIKEHVIHSYNVLKENEDLKEIATMVHDHHERWDGGGYPRGVDKDAISLGGSIIAVADAVATMATDRPYRKRLERDAIIDELNRHKGSQFAPRITEAMIELIHEGILHIIHKNA